jgi:manganese oxidase
MLYQRVWAIAFSGILAAVMPEGPARAEVPGTPPPFPECNQTMMLPGGSGRVICADVAALDQTLVYNRFGSFNPFGMIFALRRDLVPLDLATDPVAPLTAEDCDMETFTDEPFAGALGEGSVRLRDCKRPRPLTLRVNVGDTFVVRVTNLLTPPGDGEISPDVAGGENVIDFSSDVCKAGPTQDFNRESAREGLSRGDHVEGRHNEVSCPEDPPVTKAEGGAPAGRDGADWPNTRGVNFVLQGLTPEPLTEGAVVHPACMGTGSVPPGASFICLYKVTEEGSYFFASHAAPAGGEGDGGAIVHGLFGAVMAERSGSRSYRSQTSRAAFDAVWPPNAIARHARSGLPDYEKTDPQTGAPYLNMARALDVPQADFGMARLTEIVHADLNAIVWCDRSQEPYGCVPKDGAEGASPPSYAADDQAAEFGAFREFSIFFHDELKTFYTRNFEELQRFGQLSGVKDGFAINYGASGMGSILLANRKGIGPAADCMECLYEEFFLTSWANGDPALLEWFSDDPSNVHHSYMNDPIVFRNFHAGPKETHVFHLHAHQWFAGNDPNRGAYLDSQTVGPQQSFSYNIYHGGMRGLNGDGDGWWDTQGSGNRNRTVGDSIFHCHLYPHFAQGMWALWRVHDVLEDGTRKLPDGQEDAGLSLTFKPAGAHKRLGSVDRVTGAWLEPEAAPGAGEGTPIPALIPLPGEPLPLLPTYSRGDAVGMPGYPFYVPAEPGHRPPQAPLDIARDLGPQPAGEEADTRVATGDWLDGGLSRHIVKDGTGRELGFPLPPAIVAMLADPETIPGADAAERQEKRVALAQQLVAKALALGDMSGHLVEARIERLSNFGTELERAAMGFHFNGRVFTPDDPDAGGVALTLLDAQGTPVAGMEPITSGGTDTGSGQYPTLIATAPDSSAPSRKPVFSVNGSAPKPGAPFADPCGAPGDLAASYGASGVTLAFDPLYRLAGGVDETYGRDPFVTGFRRYEVSAVQLDLIVNKAGWHDPQARINVLTALSDAYKAGGGAISPYISDKEEPFFFRALSGECIEFRHTNELPKDMELDDFQVRTPTDTIGQHIHLVKFDVTSSDGSGNGWNYEDGTFAADELMARKCAAVSVTDGAGNPAELSENGGFDAGLYCENGKVRPEWEDIWRKELTEDRGLFQTTVQRWFADPILSPDELGLPRDRTLRTVFTHDHFGPSSIQQHGFYSALLIEPGAIVAADADPDSLARVNLRICAVTGTSAQDDAGCSAALPAGTDGNAMLALDTVAFGTPEWVGARKRVLNVTGGAADPFHPDTREFALAVADFALLYDPRDRRSVADLNDSLGLGSDGLPGIEDSEISSKGMEQLLCELKYYRSPYALNVKCGGDFATDAAFTADGRSWFQNGAEGWTPAWIAGGKSRDNSHMADYLGSLFLPGEFTALQAHLVSYRQKAAGMFGKALGPTEATMAGAVAGPERPEAISVDHHDPFLVNYRMAAIPLRIGDKAADMVAASPDCAPKSMSPQAAELPASEVVDALMAGSFGRCSLKFQLKGDQGDLASVFSSKVHGDPETPVFEAYQGERLMFRMIQGAQEVQHMFQIAGQPFRRNVDQAFAAGMLPLDTAFGLRHPLRADCLADASGGRPGEYLKWSDKGPDDSSVDTSFWTAREEVLAECDNIEGFTFAQEIGISEHFEMRGSLRSDVSGSLEAIPAPEGVELRFSRFDGAQGLADDYVPETSSDYLYSFGTTDAIWNGAWGLLRIYEGTASADPSTFNLSDLTDPAGVKPIGDRLAGAPMLPPERISAEGSNGSETIFRAAAPGALICPLPEAGRAPTVRRAVIAAVEARKVWGEGSVRYGDTRYDPDGLVLALVDPGALGLGVDGDAGWAGPWPDITTDAVHAAVLTGYPDGPQPFVLRANAGDCLEVRLVNALEPDDQGALRDLLGDAWLPPIAGLNADPQPVVPKRDTAGVLRADLASLADAGVDQGGLRPSASLALMFGIPSTELVRAIPLGTGFNRRALAPATGGVAVVSDVIGLYAGRYRLDLKTDEVSLVALRQGLVAAATDRANAALSLTGPADDPLGWAYAEAARSPALAPLFTDAAGIRIDRSMIAALVPSPEDRAAGGIVRIAGHVVVADFLDGAISAAVDAAAPDGFKFNGSVTDLDPLRPACAGDGACETALEAWYAAYRALLEEERDLALHKATHWIPYAFGATPIRALSDPVGQEAHGLIGVVDVLPRQWQLTDAHGVMAQTADDRGRPVALAVPLAETSDGLWADFTDTDAEGNQRSIREFVLFYRDGMNLWDSASGIRWTVDGKEIVAPFDLDGDPGPDRARPVPDCHVCDDSYDRGDKGVNYRSPALAALLSDGLGVQVEASDDFNVHVFPEDYVTWDKGVDLMVCEGQQVVIRLVHPGGRARQRVFAMNGYNYADLFPGFGFPRGALLAPGKSLTAWLDPAAVKGVTGFWHDGPTSIMSGGVWGRISVAKPGEFGCPAAAP